MIIGITGPARSGKDTAAAVIADYLNGPGELNAWVSSFAEPMKKMLVHLGLRHSQLYGPEKDRVDQRFGCTPRHMLQTLGTDWGRAMVNKDVWVRAMEVYLIDKIDVFKHIIIPDVRFENEAAMIRRLGVLLHIDGRGGIPGGHVSECGVKKMPDDYVIANTGTLDWFKADVLAILGDITAGKK